MSRDSMTELIAYSRRIIADDSGTVILSDDKLQESLDRHRCEARYELLQPLESIQPGGQVLYLTHVAPRGFWESDVKFFEASYNEIIPQSSDNITGRWTFGLSRSSVLVLGWYYDINGACADALFRWASLVKDEVDFSDGQRSFRDSQKVAAMLELAKELRAMSWSSGGVGTGAFFVTDFACVL